MAEARPNPVIDHIRQLIGNVPAVAMTDGQLLEQFLSSRDESAVEGLIRRYGPLVLGVCRRVLHDAHSAEDAFQATFLVLMRKAPSLDRAKPLRNWLYTVAYRLALRARANENRRRQCEAQAARSRPGIEGHATQPDELIVALEEELQKLPEKQRAPLVLCYLEGKTNEQAAELLGCPRGSMSARLSQARERLRACLARRGFAVTSAGIAAVLTPAATEAALPLPLLANTVRAALWFASDEAATAGVISAQAVALARGAVRAMFLNKLKITAAVLLVTAMLGTGATQLLKSAPHASPPEPLASQQQPAGGADVANAPGETLPPGALARMGTTQLRHGDAIFFAAYTPDGKALLTAGRDKTVRLWDLATGKESRRFDWTEAQATRKGDPLENGLRQKYEQQLWDDTGRSCQVALSANGMIVAASRGGVVCLWETASAKKLGRFETGQHRLIQLAFSADGASLATVSPGGQVTDFWDVATGQRIRRLPGKPAPGYQGLPSAISEQNALVSPGFKYLAYCRRDDLGVPLTHIVDLATGKEMNRIKSGTGFSVMAFSADDKTLVWDHAPEAGIVVSDVATGRELRRLESDGDPDVVAALALSADGRSLAVSRMNRTIELWDMKSCKRTFILGKVTKAQIEAQGNDWVSELVRPALAFSLDGERLVCSQGSATIRQFRARTGAAISGPGNGNQAPVSAVELSADGKSLCTYSFGDPARCWDWITGKETGRLGVPASATYAVFAGGGRFGFAVGSDFTFCDAQGKKSWKIATEGSHPASLALSPDGSLLATRNFLQPAVHLWDTLTAKERYTLGQPHDGPPVGASPATESTGVLPPDLIFSPNGRFLAGAGASRQLCLWDVATGALLWELTPQVGQAIERFAFSPNGHMLASVNVDRTISLYEAVGGAKRGRLGEADLKNRRAYVTDGNGITSQVQMGRDAPVCLAFSPDGRFLALAQHAPEIHLWDVIAGREVGHLKGHEGGVVSLRFTHDGKHLFSGGMDTTALTWDLTRLTSTRRGSPDPGAVLQPPALDTLWSELADKNATRAFDALRKLSAFPDQAITLVQERVHPVTTPDAKRLAQLLADLGNDRFEPRRKAEAELCAIGELAIPALRKALADDAPLDLRKRVERLLGKLAAPTESQLRDFRVVELLELIGSTAARQVLQGLAAGVPGARLTREAGSALQRLSKLTSKP